jgi:uncharacterized protein (TIGR02453 family)
MLLTCSEADGRRGAGGHRASRPSRGRAYPAKSPVAGGRGWSRDRAYPGLSPGTHLGAVHSGMAESPFRPALATFFRGLAAHNEKTWFEDHREQWERDVRDPMEVLLGEAERRYGAGRVLRQHRDLRFTPDKRPYREDTGLTAGGVYLSAGADGLQVGGGLYEPSSAQLRAGRSAIDEHPQAAAALQRELDDLTDAGFELAGPPLQTAPRGYDRDHPRIDLLRMQHYAALVHLPLTSPLDDIVAAWERVQPLVRWTVKWAKAADAEAADDPAPPVPGARSIDERA